MPRSQKSKLFHDIKIGFDVNTVRLGIDQITPLKIVTPIIRESEKYKQIAASIREVGIIEPPVVSPPRKGQKTYLLLDGHLRLEVLKENGETEVTCLVSTDDEAFTYNKFISRLSTIQEHRMILQAIKRGVSEETIARALNLQVDNIIQRRDLLKGICPEVADIFKHKMIPRSVFVELRRMKPVRQIEAAMLMSDSNNYTYAYVRAIVLATPKAQLVEPEKAKKVKGLDDEQMARMEAEMGSLQGEYRLIEESFGPNVLNLTVAKTYLATLLGNARIVKYLALQHPEFLTQFQKIVEMKSLGGVDGAA
ncbi:MAG: plasmid partitioning protein RepB C-terminal domain-containing protein [Alphaproteobacteria bacterium]|nr:plasmid partitioning protein RepB C-terminal domain-containing protein [Alphaproteobacteria bacterium]